MTEEQPPPKPKTLAEAAAIAISEAIISGQLPPNTKLAVRALSDMLGFGPSPIREALSRLAGRGLVTAQGQQGFRVAPTSEKDLRELMTARTVLETGALRLSIEAGGPEWEAGIVSTLQKMKHFQENLPQTPEERSEKFESLNMELHRALISSCGSKRLIVLHDELYEQTRRYRRLMLGALDVSRGIYDAHIALVESVLSRDVDLACESLIEHNNVVLNLVFDSESTPESRSSSE